MIFVKRDSSGAILAVSREPLPTEPGGGDAWQPARGDEPEVVAFSHAVVSEANPLGTTDLALVRVLEDLIELLVDRSVIRFTDLPAAAQAKLNERRSTRVAMQELRLLDEDGGDLI
ncbi:MAG TPA: hypothetical protein VJ673_22865 [Aromatoleum sp.]|uniref:hypothetical protein n=1 Tax=Aromatoleum sp. TaxID=2307007 RepID=UPI002B474A4E|nr:hypothetical protein [Aromatoleum sp.]HJV28539.1 hypothetical protein [Aromatoleum sp.]